MQRGKQVASQRVGFPLRERDSRRSLNAYRGGRVIAYIHAVKGDRAALDYYGVACSCAADRGVAGYGQDAVIVRRGAVVFKAAGSLTVGQGAGCGEGRKQCQR